MRRATWVWEWVLRHTLVFIWLGMGAIVIAGFLAQQATVRARAEALRMHTEEIAAELKVEREHADQALCYGIETFTNKLIEVPSENRSTPQAQRQATIDSFQQSLDDGFAEFGCVFHLSPAPP